MAVFVLLAATGQAVAATAGVFQFVAGDVRVILATGSERPARKNSPVSVGDTVATSMASVAQIKMGDGAIVVVQPESRLTVAEFRFAGKVDGSEKVVFRLEQGGFRSVTGAIGHTHQGSYLIETPIAHIGVRGTDHETYYFPTAGSGSGEPAQAGVYNKVNVGLTFIRTQSGEVAIGPNQIGFAASAQDVPRLLPAMPQFFNRAIEPRSAQRGGPGGAAQVSAGGALPAQVVQTVVLTGGLDLSNLASSSAGAGSGGGAGTATPTGLSGSVVGYTPSSAAVKTFSGVNPSVSSTGATLANAGGDLAFGVNWGSWQGGLATVGDSATTGATHYATSTNLTTPAQLEAMPSSLVSATYNYLNGPPPTDSSGAQGKINSLKVDVNFSTQAITNYAVNATVGAATWDASGKGTITNFTGASSSIALSGTCTGCADGGRPTASGTANGAFVGSAAERMITSFGLKAANQAMSGVGFLSR